MILESCKAPRNAFRGGLITLHQPDVETLERIALGQLEPAEERQQNGDAFARPHAFEHGQLASKHAADYSHLVTLRKPGNSR